MKNGWVKEDIMNLSIYLRMHDDVQYGIIKVPTFDEKYSATFTEYLDDSIIDTTRYFSHLLECFLYVDSILNTYFEIDFPEEYPLPTSNVELYGEPSK